MRRIFLSIFFVLVFIASCTKEPNELQRCIEANLEISHKKDEHKRIIENSPAVINDALINQFYDEIVIEAVKKDIQITDLPPKEAIEKYLDSYNVYDANYFGLVFSCEGNRNNKCLVSDIEFNISVEMDGSYVPERLPHLIRLYNYNISYYEDLYRAEFIEIAKNTCHSQGIY